MNDAILSETIGHTTLLTLNNPPAHTWTPESLEQLTQIVLDLDDDKDNMALVITGSGEKFFSAGADLNHFNHSDIALTTRFARAFGDAFQTLTNYRGVSIAAINGFAMGGGLEAALSCDIRIAERHALMALPECSVGLLPCGLGTQQLPTLVGEQWAKRMILLGEKVDAEQAMSIGLISEITEKGESRALALTFAEKLGKQSPLAVRYCKELILGARKNTINPMFAKERELFIQLFNTNDRQEGVQAFLEKRSAKWTHS